MSSFSYSSRSDKGLTKEDKEILKEILSSELTEYYKQSPLQFVSIFIDFMLVNMYVGKYSSFEEFTREKIRQLFSGFFNVDLLKFFDVKGYEEAVIKDKYISFDIEGQTYIFKKFMVEN